MAMSRTGFIRYALLRLAGFAALLLATVFLLNLLLSGNAGLDTAALALAAERLAVTLPLALLALLFALALGIPAGYVAATAPTPLLGGPVRVLSRLLLSAPAFWLGMVLVLVVAVVFRLPAPGGFMPWQQSVFGALSSLLTPAAALALPLAAMVAGRVDREVRALSASPAHFATRANGSTSAQATLLLSRRLVPTTAVLIGSRAGMVLAGAMMIEPVFYLPGLGRLLFESVAAGDKPAVAAALLVLVATSAAASLIGDILRVAQDPRLAGSLT